MLLNEAQRQILLRMNEGEMIYCGMGSIKLMPSNTPVDITMVAFLHQHDLSFRDLSEQRFVIHRISEKGKVELHLSRLEEENTRLRAALAQSDQPCAYCSLPAAKWAECKNGFPGCGRADDAMGCPELGARMQLDETYKQIKNLLHWIDTGERLES